jgi:uracil-DNA glycosylase
LSDRAINLEPSWLQQLGAEFDKDYMRSLREFLMQRKQQGATIYPAGANYFAAFDHTPFDDVKVVMLGQDPYHGPGQAHGLCFSVPEGIAQPPSLVNIFKEIENDLGIAAPAHGNLQAWARQGVLLLNSVLTVEQANAGSHQGKGWEQFTDEVIARLNAEREGIVCMLWGAYAQRKGQIIDTGRHLVLKAPHPSPLSAYRGFFGCGHFSQANAYLQQRGEQPINWQL